jgi:cob(I)alamin adenosyltransferase
MSIVTRTGDEGTTALMYGRRVSKCHPRVEACGTVDELNAAIGLARAATQQDFVRQQLLPIQQELIVLMGELSTALEDLPRFTKDGFSLVTPEMIARMERSAQEVQSAGKSLKGWATPGANMASGALDLARTVCRRAERRVCALQEAGQLRSTEMIIYLNRLSDLLWLLARWVEAQQA